MMVASNTAIDNKNNLQIILQKNSMDSSIYKKFAKVPNNTAPYSTTSTKKTILRKHLLEIFYGGDEKAFLVKS